MKPFGHPVVEFFDKGVGFCWRAYRNLGTGYTCDDSVIGPFADMVGTNTPLTAFNEMRITYLVATNAGWLPYLVDEGVRFVHYSANRVRRQFGLDQDILDDFSAILEFATSVRPFQRPSAFELWNRRFTAVTIPGSQREGLCIAMMHGYW